VNTTRIILEIKVFHFDEKAENFRRLKRIALKQAASNIKVK
jgi:hypothetical protein